MTALQVAPIVLGLLVLLPALLLSRRKPDPARQALRSLATPRDVAPLTPRGVEAAARRLRKDLPERPLQHDIGVVLGRLEPRGPILRASWEDSLLAIMAPRSGKTTALAIPTVLAAPGACLATSNKPDLLAATAELRAEVGTVYVFDPQGVARAPRGFWFDPLQDLDVEGAGRLARHFVSTVEKDRGDIWAPAAAELLAGLMLAAACAGRDLLAVYAWLSDDRAPEPVAVLRQNGLHAVADSLLGLQHAAVETRASVYFTARVATTCLRDPGIAAWVTPPDEPLERLDPDLFVRGRNTLFAMSKDSGGSAAPLVAALVDRVLRAATAESERHGAPLDPPLVAVLDEAANVAPVADLPMQYSHAGSRGIVLLTILQSLAQARAVWGQDGAAALWGASTVKVLGSGIDDADLAENVSKLVGDHDVEVVTRSSGAGKRSRSTSTRQQRVLPASAIRALQRGQALLLVTGTRAALVRLCPWYSGPRAAAIAAATERAVQAIAARGRAA